MVWGVIRWYGLGVWFGGMIRGMIRRYDSGVWFVHVEPFSLLKTWTHNKWKGPYVAEVKKGRCTSKQQNDVFFLKKRFNLEDLVVSKRCFFFGWVDVLTFVARWFHVKEYWSNPGFVRFTQCFSKTIVWPLPILARGSLDFQGNYYVKFLLAPDFWMSLFWRTFHFTQQIGVSVSQSNTVFQTIMFRIHVEICRVDAHTNTHTHTLIWDDIELQHLIPMDQKLTSS